LDEADDREQLADKQQVEALVSDFFNASVVTAELLRGELLQLGEEVHEDDDEDTLKSGLARLVDAEGFLQQRGVGQPPRGSGVASLLPTVPASLTPL
jgi:hypothetical protein